MSNLLSDTEFKWFGRIFMTVFILACLNGIYSYITFPKVITDNVIYELYQVQDRINGVRRDREELISYTDNRYNILMDKMAVLEIKMAVISKNLKRYIELKENK